MRDTYVGVTAECIKKDVDGGLLVIFNIKGVF